ncbi:MAG TPA: hypothetical protein VFD67_01070 [Gemmatimonadaceae bacterium]|nr:hypothetical protein [Gemmatimonadaceae bacterium]
MKKLLLLVGLLQGCVQFTGSATALHPLPRDSTARLRGCDSVAGCVGTVRFTYLGVGGFLIATDSDAIMTAPSFSHPRLLAVATPLWPIHGDSEVVDRELQRLLGADMEILPRVHSILVGHAHYDHLMDVPLVARRFAPAARIYGSLTTKRTLMGDTFLRAHADRVDSLMPADSVIATAWRVGRWMYSPSRRMRFMAVHSSHAPNWWFVTIAPCQEKADRKSLPRTGWGWCRGEPVSYVIDLLDGRGRPVFRMFYQDAASRPTDVVLPPFAGADQRRVDLAIVCAGNFKKVEEYPTFLLAGLRPTFVILAHWEDFFQAQGDAPTPVPRTDTRELATRLDLMGSARWITPVPGGHVVVEY